MNLDPTFRKPFIWLALAVVVLVVAAVSFYRASSGSSDFDVYYYAAKAVRFGETLYTINRHGTSEAGSPFVYPPFFAFLMVPLTVFPVGVAAILWNFFNLGLLVGCVQLAMRLTPGTPGEFQIENRSGRFWIVLCSGLVMMWFVDNIAMAQVNLLVLFFILLSFYLRFQNQKVAAGFSLGLSVVIKLIPLLFLPYFVIKKDWKFVLGFVLALIPAFVIVPAGAVGFERSVAYHRAWVEETLKDQTQPKTLGFYASQLSPSHQNLQAVLFRLIIDPEFRERTGGPNGKRFKFHTPIRLTEQQAAVMSRILAFAAAAGLFLVLLVSEKRHSFLASVSAIFCGMVLLAPKTRSHFFIFLLIPIIYLVRKILIKGENSRAIGPEKKVLFVSAVLYFLQGIKYMKFLGAGCWSVLILFLYFLLEVLRPNEEAA